MADVTLGEQRHMASSCDYTLPQQAYTCCKVAINIFNNKGYNEGKWRIHYGEVKGKLRVPGNFLTEKNGSVILSSRRSRPQMSITLHNSHQF